VQREARRFFCYLFISHSSLIFMGLDAVTPHALAGALCMWLSVTLGLTGFGLTLRAIEARHGRVILSGKHGYYGHTPLIATCYLITGLASVGFPGTFGFLGAELLLDGIVQAYPSDGMVVVLVSALNGIAVMQTYFTIFAGSHRTTTVSLRSRVRERIAVLTLAAIIFGGAIFPQASVSSRYRAALELLTERGASVDKSVEDHVGPEATESPPNVVSSRHATVDARHD
jgi:NADH-quinone oxidoreductase subunit M